MDREEAIDYLEEKGELQSKKYTEREEKVPTEKELVAEDEKKIKDVMKRGKIYGDPKVCLY